VKELEKRHGPRSALWTYHDAQGEPVGLVLRWNRSDGQKDIRPVSRHPDGWSNSGMPEPRPLYGLPDLAAAETIYVVEGEKAAEAARSIGLIATTSAHGSQSPGKTDWAPLAGKTVVILPDNDAAGKAYAEAVATLLGDLKPPPMVKVVELPGLPAKGDIADWIEAQIDCVDHGSLRNKVESLATAAQPIERSTHDVPDRFRPFPVYALPQPLRGFVTAGSKAIGCDPSFVALPLLAAVAGAIGNSRRIQLKPGWTAPPIVWVAIVGESGTAKTPAFKQVMRAARRRQEKAFDQYAEARRKYKTDLAQFEKSKSAWKKDKKTSAEPPQEPEAPHATRYLVGDTTVEALAPILSTNPRGVLLFRDELAGWFGSFDRYASSKRGGDVASWLSMFNGESITVDRKTGDPPTIFVREACVSICGGIQPRILFRVLGSEHWESGLAARLLLACPPRRSKQWSDAKIDPGIETETEKLFDRLYELEMPADDDGRPRPVVITLAPRAKTVWIAYYDSHNREQVDLSGDMSAAWSKLEEYPARFALIIHLTRWAAADPTLVSVDQVDDVSMSAGIALAQWFKGETRRVYTILQESDEDRDQRRLAEWIEVKGGLVTARQVQQGCRWLKGPNEAEAALEALATAGWGCWHQEPASPEGGRPSRVFQLARVSTVYETLSNAAESGGFVDADGAETAASEVPESAEPAVADASESTPLPQTCVVPPLPTGDLEGPADEPTPAIQDSSPGEPFKYLFWDGQKLQSSQRSPLGLDVETERIEDDRTIPRLALATVTDGKQHFVIHPDRVGDFLEVHRQEWFVGHSVQFDFWVIDEHLQRTGHPAQRVLWDACDRGRLRDTMILDMLIQLATGKYRKATGRGGKEEIRIIPGNLADIASDYSTTKVSKDDPYRLRFGELVDLSPDELRDADPAFFQYAIADVAATRQAYLAQCDVANRLMAEYGFCESADRYEIRPDAIERFGYLSEIVQVKASIVLSYMYRRGVHVDQDGANELMKLYEARLAEIVRDLQEHFPEVLSYDKTGKIKTTPKGKAPSWNQAKLTAILQRVAEEIRANGQPVETPQSKGKKPGVSLSVKDWQKYAPLHRFLQIWSELKRLEKLLGFAGKLDAPILHCKYGLLTRTGRTACSAPSGTPFPGVNLQQIPKLAEFRRLVVARQADHKLFIADYSAIELRTLGAVCRAKYGASKLADVIEQGVDPHAFTAAAIQGMSLDDFLALKVTDPARFRTARQAAKAINFGVPGGLGAKALREYAESNYGVSLTEDEAEAFRTKLISEVFPELNDQDGYLADTGMALLARSLGLPVPLVWDTLDAPGSRNTLAARGVAKVVRGNSTASHGYQAKVWTGLQQLVSSSSNVDALVARALQTRQGSPALYEQLYRQKVATLTGRIRGGVSFTESKNTPFQSLAADGAKLALWNLLYAGFDVYGFVHDEIIVDLLAESAEQDSLRIKDIMKGSMEEVLGGIPAACESEVSDCWAKPG